MKEMSFYSEPYDGENVDFYDRLPSMELDPILVGGTSSLSVILVASRRFTFIYNAVLMIAEDFHCGNVFFKTALLPGERTFPRKVTATKWERHLNDLCKFKVIERQLCGSLLALSTYFAVPKNEFFARSIFNGRLLSAQFQVPPPVNLPFLPRTLKLMTTIVWECVDGISVCLGDLRHFFHQLLMHPSLWKFFGLLCNGKYYQWKTLPMGWSFSPYIAQSIAMLVMLHREKDELLLFDEVLTQLPELLRPHDPSVQGFATVFYDNFFAVSSNHQWSRAVFDRITRNLKIFNLTMKEWIFMTPKLLRHSSIRYLGAEIKVTRKRVDDKWQYDCTWRIPDDKVIAITTCPNKMTARQAASCIGKVMWHHIMTMEPLVTIHALIDVLREVGRSPSWNSTFDLSEKHHHTLQVAIDNCRRNDWISLCRSTVSKEQQQTIFMCSDSSDNGWGYIVWKNEGHIERAFQWGNMASSHIFIKELVAAIWSVTAVVRTLSCNI